MLHVVVAHAAECLFILAVIQPFEETVFFRLYHVHSSRFNEMFVILAQSDHASGRIVRNHAVAVDTHRKFAVFEQTAYFDHTYGCRLRHLHTVLGSCCNLGVIIRDHSARADRGAIVWFMSNPVFQHFTFAGEKPCNIKIGKFNNNFIYRVRLKGFSHCSDISRR